MSVMVLRTINCDQRVAKGCLFWDTEGSPENASTLRAQLKRDGWAVNRPGGEDICPQCVIHIGSAGAPQASTVL